MRIFVFSALLIFLAACSTTAVRDPERKVANTQEWPLFECKHGIEYQEGPFAEKVIAFYSKDRRNYVVKAGTLNLNADGIFYPKKTETDLIRSVNGDTVLFTNQNLTITMRKEGKKVIARTTPSIFIFEDQAARREEAYDDQKWGFACKGSNLEAEFQP